MPEDNLYKIWGYILHEAAVLNGKPPVTRKRVGVVLSG